MHERKTAVTVRTHSKYSSQYTVPTHLLNSSGVQPHSPEVVRVMSCDYKAPDALAHSSDPARQRPNTRRTTLGCHGEEIHRFDEIAPPEDVLSARTVPENRVPQI